MVGNGGGLVGVGASVGALVEVAAGTCVGDGAVVGVGCGVADGDGDGTGVGAANARAGSPSALRPSAPALRLTCRMKSRRSIRSDSRQESGCRYKRPTSLTGTRRAREKSSKGNSRSRNFVLVVSMKGDVRVRHSDRAVDWAVTSANVASLVRLKPQSALSGRLANHQADKCLTISLKVVPLGSRLVRRGASYAQLACGGLKPPPRPRTGWGGFFDPLEKGPRSNQTQ
jgi:hypothetical protein